MLSRLSTRPFLVTAAAAAAVFVAVLVLMAVRMAGGDDPALGASADHRSASKPAAAQTQTPVVPQAQYPPAYDDGGYSTYDDGGYGTYDDGSGSSGGYAVPSQSAPAPMQSGTS